MVGAKSWYLPYHVCLSDLLFGEALYDTRRAYPAAAAPAPNRFVPAEPTSVAAAGAGRLRAGRRGAGGDQRGYGGTPTWTEPSAERRCCPHRRLSRARHRRRRSLPQPLDDPGP